MGKKKHPLDSEFDFFKDPDKQNDDVFADDIFDISIPENPTLEDIANIALKAYKSHMCDIQNMEPKYRARNLEVAQLYLSIAKDSLSKKEEIKIKGDKLVFDKKKHDNKDGGDDDSVGTRKNLLEELQQTLKDA